MELIAKESAMILGLVDDIAMEGIIPDKWKDSAKTAFQEFYKSAMKRLTSLKETIGEQIKKLGKFIVGKLEGTKAGYILIDKWNKAIKYGKPIKRLFVEIIRLFVGIDESKYKIDYDNESEDEIYAKLVKKFNHDYERIYEELREINDHVLDDYKVTLEEFYKWSDAQLKEIKQISDKDEQDAKFAEYTAEWSRQNANHDNQFDEGVNKQNKLRSIMTKASIDYSKSKGSSINGDHIMDMINNAIENVKKMSGTFNKSIDNSKTKNKVPLYTKIIGLMSKLVGIVVNIITFPFRIIKEAKEKKSSK